MTIRKPGARRPWGSPPDSEAALELQAFDPGFRGQWTWVQPARFRPHWRLMCNDAIVATLATRGLLVSSSLARFAHESWELRHRFPAGLDVTRTGDAEPWGRYRPGWFVSGRVTRAHDSTLLWRPEGFWMRSWSFTTTDQLPLVHFRRSGGLVRHGSIVELEDAARRMPDLPALLATGWLLALHSRRRRRVH